ncbi:hypothetical protein FB451DRAFT_1419699 [Mycena latifolia]|nr:hypothetical protein FB451DRAFT_1419699 [Mycena latifolia]
MDDTIINDDEEDQCFKKHWISTEWIACGKEYRNIPPIVEAARRSILKIPPSLINNLPSKTLSIAELLGFELPLICEPMDDGTEWFSEETASPNVEELIPFLAVPTCGVVQHLLNKFGQAWFDGKKTIRTCINPEIIFPFWVLTYWVKILDASDAKDRWIRAASWLDNTGKTMDELAAKRTVKGLWKVISWHGNLPGFGSSIPVVDLVSFFSQDYLAGNLVDAMMNLLSIRLAGSDGPVSDSTLVVDTTFSQFLQLLLPTEDGKRPIDILPGAQKYLKKYGSWFHSPDHTALYFVLHRPPNHWTACAIDFQSKHIRYGDSLGWKRPKDFFQALRSWTAEHFAGTAFLVTDDLPCASQTDGFNCPIISVNTVAHNALGDALWTSKTVRVLRMKAFCDISQHALSAKNISTLLRRIPDPDDAADNLLAANPDFNDVRMGPSANEAPAVAVAVQRASEGTPVLVGESVVQVRGAQRPAETSSEGDERAKKQTKTSDRSARPIHSFFDRGPKAQPKSKSAKKVAAGSTTAAIGISKSASAARQQREAVKNGTFQASATKTRNFQEKCRSFDSGACFEETASKVQCSTCKKWKAMKEPYNFSCFREHVEAGKCIPPPPEPETVKQTLHHFQLVPTRPKPKNPPPPPTVTRPCPGLTREFNKVVSNYLDRTVLTGGGGHSVNHYSEKLFQMEFTDLTEKQKETVYTARLHDYTWRNDTSPGIMACFAAGRTPCLMSVVINATDSTTPPCSSCRLLTTMKAFKNAINREAPEPSNLKFVPRINQNTHAGMLYAKFHGLEELISEENEWSLECRFFQHVVSGKFKNDTVFRGIMQAKVLAKDREIRGVGNQNFKYDTDMDTLFGLIHTISPRAYRELAKHFPLRTERSIKHIISTTPRFPIGVTDETFIYAQRYCDDYKYLHGAPLSLSVDDTKLFPTLRPIYDGVKGKWFIVGTMGEHIEVPNPEALHHTLDRLESTAELATKLRLWVLQIPLPGVPPLVLAIAPLGSKVKGAQLADWQIQLMEGLVACGFRITSSSGDGASVERDCQRHTAAASKLKEFRIKHPDPAYPDIIVQLWDLHGNIWVQAAEDPGENLGLVVYLLIFGDFIDAWQSRTLSHFERAKILIRTHLFLNTWRNFLAKAGYPEARHFISKEAFDIAQILINSLLGLIVIHRDHLGNNLCPLLPWFHASEPNEHCYSGMHDISPDMTMQQAILIVPKLRAKMQSAVRTRKTEKDFKKQASRYCHTYYSSQDIDYELLSQYPTDIEFSAAYEAAQQENDALWSMLGVHPDRINSVPIPGIVPPPPPDPVFEHLYLQEDADGEQGAPEKTPAEELQEMIDSLKTTASLSRAADEQLDACVMASVALSMDELAKIEDLPESNPERFAEIQKDIVYAMSTQPAAFFALLQGMADSAVKNPLGPVPPVENPPVSHLLIDVSLDNLSPLVNLRREYQTEEARKGISTYKGSGTYITRKGVEKPLTECQILARQMQAIIGQDQERGSSTGLNRKVRWTGVGEASSTRDDTTATKPKTGNAANAELAASGRSKEAIK